MYFPNSNNNGKRPYMLERPPDELMMPYGENSSNYGPQRMNHDPYFPDRFRPYQPRWNPYHGHGLPLNMDYDHMFMNQPPGFQPPIETPSASMEENKKKCEGDEAPDQLRRYDHFENFSLQERITMSVRCTSTLCTINWSVSTAFPVAKYQFHVILRKNGVVIAHDKLDVRKFTHTFATLPGETYQAEVRIIQLSDGSVVQKEQHTFKATFSSEEMDELYDMAARFVGQQPLQMFKILYRAKPKYYFDDVMINHKQIMEKYIKDENGHRATPINGSIRGLFFSAETNNGVLPNCSPFGDTRIKIDAPKLVNPGCVNVYFADFYCNSRPHYVTIVVCLKGTNQDDFCKKTLKQLNYYDNPFLKVVAASGDEGPEYMFFVNNVVHVEICYTENIPLSMGEVDTITPFGKGTSKIGGVPNNKNCTLCNFHRPQNPLLFAGDQPTLTVSLPPAPKPVVKPVVDNSGDKIKVEETSVQDATVATVEDIVTALSEPKIEESEERTPSPEPEGAQAAVEAGAGYAIRDRVDPSPPTVPQDEIEALFTFQGYTDAYYGINKMKLPPTPPLCLSPTFNLSPVNTVYADYVPVKVRYVTPEEEICQIVNEIVEQVGCDADMERMVKILDKCSATTELMEVDPTLFKSLRSLLYSI